MLPKPRYAFLFFSFIFHIPTPFPLQDTPAAPTEAVADAPAAEVTQEAAAATEGEATKKDDRPKSPSLISKLLAPFKAAKGEKKVKAPKSPRKAKKESSASSEEPAKEEAPAEEAQAAAPAPAPEAPAAPAPEAAAAVAETPAETKPAEATEVKEKKESKVKLGRRISVGISNTFHFLTPKTKSDVTTPAKVDENPPQIDNPEPVAPLDVAQESAPAPAEEAPKPIEPSPPVVAATA